ncbi:hypothetical protein IWZ00DRAFT_514368 [Phyllosticta capitalensis]
MRLSMFVYLPTIIRLTCCSSPLLRPPSMLLSRPNVLRLRHERSFSSATVVAIGSRSLFCPLSQISSIDLSAS